LACNQGSLAGLRTQDSNSLCAAIMIGVTLVYVQTQTQTDSIMTSLYGQTGQLS